ncbi:non-ribosomal peptide synthetase [Paenibacillus sp. IHBB 10380]|uniref:non-ribosomal peptide synthetase n=1 Tax=Paenibacillus sp. IHBB 10380 TaxID=1566358 RepID=UPI0005CFDE2F|nr:non-ribosomal peptide synthetase [Paenibacillus sp. IHBB 10380]AJS57208.1 hypothetical protein UB51_00355 [Paenibacillus sp. IHBB 10380]
MNRLTYSQKGVYNAECLYNNSPLFNIGGYILLSDMVEYRILEKAINYLVQGQSAFRTMITKTDSGPFQYVVDPGCINIPHKEFNPSEYFDYVSELFKKPFNLYESPLFYFEICGISDGTSILIVKLHHIISDGWSMAVIARQISEYYDKCSQELHPSINVFDFQNVLKREQAYIESSHSLKSYEYLLQKREEISSIEKVCKSSVNTRGERKTFILSKELIESMHKFANENGYSINHLFTAAFSLLIRYFDQNDNVNIGVPIYNRQNANEKNTVGMFTNMLLLILNICDEMTISEYLKLVKSQLRAESKHVKYPYEKFQEDIGNDSGYTYEYSINFYNMEFAEMFCGIKSTYHNVYSGCQQYKLQMIVYGWESDSRINVAFDYRLDSYDEAMINEVFSVLEKICLCITRNDGEIGDINYISEKEKHKLIKVYDHTEKIHKNGIFSMFMNNVTSNPSTIAIIDQETTYTYQQLYELIMKYAAGLNELQVRQGDIVVLNASHSVELVATIYAITYIGAVFVPLDKEWPDERKSYIINEVTPKLILTDVELKISNYTVVDLYGEFSCGNCTSLPKFSDKQRKTLYMIYTSGTTGSPKGVVVSNTAVLNYLLWAGHAYSVSNMDTFPLYSTLAFDFTLTSLFLPLCFGAAIKIYQESKLLSHPIFSIVQDNIATIVKVTPSHLNLLNSRSYSNSSIRAFIVGGEKLLGETVEKSIGCFNHQIQYFNEYGPTEATIGCMYYSYDGITADGAVPIGKPIDNVSIYILDRKCRAVGKYVTGEIYISGRCLAEGYYNNFTQTEEKFLPDPFSPGQMMYKTGDIAKYMSDNTMVYLGRMDSQVKIRGYRVELAEISTITMRNEAIIDCVVDVEEENGSIILVLYTVWKNGYTYSEYSLRDYLSKYLASYLTPSEIYQVDELPLTTNGKLDYRRLWEIRIERNYQSKLNKDYFEDLSPDEAVLLKVVSQVLNTTDLSVYDNFTRLGGDSIKAIITVQNLQNYHYTVQVNDILTSTDLRELAGKMQKEQSKIRGKDAYYGQVRLSSVIRRFVETQSLMNNTSSHSIVIELNNQISVEKLQDVFNRMLAMHPTLTMNLSEDKQHLYYNPKHRMNEISILNHGGLCNEDREFNLYNDLLIRVDRLSLQTFRIIIHHLVIDYVSWNILLQDLQYLLNYVDKLDQAIVLPEAASYADYILQENEECQGKLFSKLCNQSSKEKYMYSIEQKGLRDKLTHSSENHHISVESLLYTLFAKQCMESYGLERISIELEGHGREHVGEGLEHVVGWMTHFNYVSFTNNIAINFHESLPPALEYYEDLNQVVRFNYLGQMRSQYDAFKIKQLKEELQSFKYDDLLDYFMEVDMFFESDDQLSIWITTNTAKYKEPLNFINEYMEGLKYLLDNSSQDIKTNITYIDEDIELEDLETLLGKNI